MAKDIHLDIPVELRCDPDEPYASEYENESMLFEGSRALELCERRELLHYWTQLAQQFEIPDLLLPKNANVILTSAGRALMSDFIDMQNLDSQSYKVTWLIVSDTFTRYQAYGFNHFAARGLTAQGIFDAVNLIIYGLNKEDMDKRIIGIIVVTLIIGIIIVVVLYLTGNLNTSYAAGVEPSVTPITSSSQRYYLASASYGDLMSIEVNEESKQLIYTNQTNDDSGTVDISSTDRNMMDFADGTAFMKAMEVKDVGILALYNKSGPDQDTLCFALGVQATSNPTVAEFIDPSLPRNYLQMRTSNAGHEIGYMFCVGSEAFHRHFSSHEAWIRESDGTVNSAAINSEEMKFAFNDNNIEAKDNYLILTQDESDGKGNVHSSSISVFFTEDQSMVMDMENGALMMLPQLSNHLAIAGSYQGLLFGKDDADALPDNAGEAGTPLGHTIILTISDVTGTGEDADSASCQFIWAESDATTDEQVFSYTGTLKPFTSADGAYALAEDLTTYPHRAMRGAHYARVVNNDGDSLDYMVIFGPNDLILVASYTHEVATSTEFGNHLYRYRYGSAMRVS